MSGEDKKKVILALRCADADLHGTLQRDDQCQLGLDKHDRSAIDQTRDEIKEALKIIKKEKTNERQS
jgi:hypothetical protein